MLLEKNQVRNLVVVIILVQDFKVHGMVQNPKTRGQGLVPQKKLVLAPSTILMERRTDQALLQVSIRDLPQDLNLNLTKMLVLLLIQDSKLHRTVPHHRAQAQSLVQRMKTN